MCVGHNTFFFDWRETMASAWFIPPSRYDLVRKNADVIVPVLEAAARKAQCTPGVGFSIERPFSEVQCEPGNVLRDVQKHLFMAKRCSSLFDRGRPDLSYFAGKCESGWVCFSQVYTTLCCGPRGKPDVVRDVEWHLRSVDPNLGKVQKAKRPGVCFCTRMYAFHDTVWRSLCYLMDLVTVAILARDLQAAEAEAHFTAELSKAWPQLMGSLKKRR